VTGQNFLNFLVGKTGQIGLLDKNVNDTSYRAFMLDCLNLVLKDIQNRQQSWHWRWLEKTATAPTVAGQIDYDLPTDVDTNKIFAVYDRTNDRTYGYLPYDEFVKLIADPSNSSGEAVLYTFWASMIKLWPIPASVITFYLDYISLITALTDATVACEIPAKYDNVVIDGALVYGYKFDPDMGDWKQQQAIYEAGIAKMIADNGAMINELGRTQGHRTRCIGADNGKHGAFPLDASF